MYSLSIKINNKLAEKILKYCKQHGKKELEQEVRVALETFLNKSVEQKYNNGVLLSDTEVIFGPRR